MSTLHALDDDLWVATRPLAFLGLRVGARMTVVRLSGGGLWVHSPVALDDGLRGELDDLGPVQHVVAPSLFHHLSAGEYGAAYPDAKLHGVPGLDRKRKDIAWHAEIGDDPHPDWEGQIDQVPIRGTMLGETVFLHRASRTMLSCDLVENFNECDHFITRTYLKLGGVFGKPGCNRLLKLAFRNRAAARASIDRALAWEFERLVLSHGEVVTERGPEVLRSSYTWLEA